MTELYLVRHGQTEWSRSGQHTSVTDLDLTEEGVRQALSLRSRLHPADFQLVLSSPRLRARRTAELAGFRDVEVTDDLAEWYYGDFEGLTSAEIRRTVARLADLVQRVPRRRIGRSGACPADPCRGTSSGVRGRTGDLLRPRACVPGAGVVLARLPAHLRAELPARGGERVHPRHGRRNRPPSCAGTAEQFDSALRVFATRAVGSPGSERWSNLEARSHLISGASTRRTWRRRRPPPRPPSRRCARCWCTARSTSRRSTSRGRPWVD